jgi:hypothetical protein
MAFGLPDEIAMRRRDGMVNVGFIISDGTAVMGRRAARLPAMLVN